jgi:hypothetical protein
MLPTSRTARVFYYSTWSKSHVRGPTVANYSRNMLHILWALLTFVSFSFYFFYIYLHIIPPYFCLYHIFFYKFVLVLASRFDMWLGYLCAKFILHFSSFFLFLIYFSQFLERKISFVSLLTFQLSERRIIWNFENESYFVYSSGKKPHVVKTGSHQLVLNRSKREWKRNRRFLPL